MVYQIAKLLFVFTLLLPIAVEAQSGRRLPKGSPPVATPTPEIEIVREPTPPPKPDFTVKFVSDIPRAGPAAFLSPENLHRWTVERLRRSTLLDVKDMGTLNRRDAIKRAKAETASYVALVEMQNDMFGGANARATTVVVWVYDPVTAKVKKTRSLAIGQNSTRMPGSTNVLRACYPTVYGEQILLLEASIEAADVILRAFNVPVPPICGNVGS